MTSNAEADFNKVKALCLKTINKANIEAKKKGSFISRINDPKFKL